MGELTRARIALDERGQRLGELEEKTAGMMTSAEAFSKHAHEVTKRGHLHTVITLDIEAQRKKAYVEMPLIVSHPGSHYSPFSTWEKSPFLKNCNALTHYYLGDNLEENLPLVQGQSGLHTLLLSQSLKIISC